MKETLEVIEAWKASEARGEPAVLATVVQVAGSAYRRPGARMLFASGDRRIGLVSGGCLEEDLAERAAGLGTGDDPLTVVYDMRSPDDIVWGLGLGCNGEIRVFLERLVPGDTPAYLRFIEDCCRKRRPGAVATLFETGDGAAAPVGLRVLASPGETTEAPALGDELGQAVEADLLQALDSRQSRVATYEAAQGRIAALIEYVPPGVQLIVFGAGQDAIPVVRQASQLGWSTTVLDHRPAYADRRRLPEADEVRLVDFDRIDRADLTFDAGTAAVVMTHHFLHDLKLLEFLLPRELPYLGLLGPRQRTENLLAELQKTGVTPSETQRNRLFGPVGLDIGSETPEEIALALAAEIRAVLSGRSGGFLRDRRGPLHDWPS